MPPASTSQRSLVAAGDQAFLFDNGTWRLTRTAAPTPGTMGCQLVPGGAGGALVMLDGADDTTAPALRHPLPFVTSSSRAPRQASRLAFLGYRCAP